MKFFSFHLMPYGPLDLEEADKYRSSWVVLPNTMYDPKVGAKLYNRYLDELEYADELGFDGICVNEHHQTAYGLMPAPNVLAGALARRTSNSKIAILGRALPLVNNPLSIAEEYSMLDNLTEGRIICGFVRGIGSEYHASGVNPTQSHERFHEAHDLIIEAWTKPGPFSWEGKYYNYRYVNTWPRVYQTPHPPIWIPSQGSAETIEWAAHPSRKYPFIITFSPAASVVRFLTLYQEQAEAYGYTADPGQLGWALPVYIADTDEQARNEARPHIEAMFNNFLRMPIEMLLPPGYTSMGSMKRILESKKGVTTDRMTIEKILELDTALIGSAETVRQKIEHYRSQVPIGNLVAMLQFASLPADLTRKNIAAFAEQVMPHFRDKPGTTVKPEPATA
jgi:alkanesulfonate monooxygenase SsuD/methylene tetrahydromethanopterin reductase-like flavin-dependent oxidoreductase (luciferase family)